LITGKTSQVIVLRTPKGKGKTMNSKIKISPILLLLCFLGILSIGYLVGRQSNTATTSYPQGVILDSGPGLDNIQAVTDIFLQAWNKRDAAGCAITYSKDAIFMPPGQESVEGRDNIRKLFNDHEWEVAEDAAMNIEEEVEEVIYFAGWAVMRGLGEITVSETDSTEDIYRFKWVMLSKKNELGEWESVWDIFNDI
jgi:uncharacterized protein (TIGR02246 family)